MSKHGEYLEQCTVIQWFRLAHPNLKECLWTTPNGSHLNSATAYSAKIKNDKLRKKQEAINRAKQMARLKKEGFKNGVSDLTLAVPSTEWAGLFIEMKDKGKTYSSVSSDQRRHIQLMLMLGYYATWAPGADKAINVIKCYMKHVPKKTLTTNFNKLIEELST